MQPVTQRRPASGAAIPTRPRQRYTLMLALALAIALCTAGSSASANSTTAAIRELARIYAQDSIQTGGSIGIEIGVVYGKEPPRFITAGEAIAGAPVGGEFTPDSIFQIGSVTKVFTTNLLGQSVAAVWT